jgi:hypothetical protein
MTFGFWRSRSGEGLKRGHVDIYSKNSLPHRCVCVCARRYEANIVLQAIQHPIIGNLSLRNAREGGGAGS